MALPPHVVLVPCIASGHAIPFLRFARRLAAAGVVATVVTSDRHALELKDALGSTDLSSLGGLLRLVGLRDHQSLEISHEEWRRRVREVRETYEAVIALLQAVVVDLASPQSQQLLGVAPAAPPVCILRDMFVPWAQEAALNLRIQKHLLFVSGTVCLSVDLQSPRLFREGRIPVTKETRDMVFSDIPGLPRLSALDLPSSYLHVTNSTMCDWMEKCQATFQLDSVILVNSFYDIEKPVLDAVRNEVLGAPNGVQAKQILDIGPLLPDTYVNENMVQEEKEEAEAEEGDPCMLWLENRAPKSVVYISFGSGATHKPPQLLELALGLEASGCSFLWLVRPPNSLEISAASGPSMSVTEFLPPGFEQRVHGRGMCYSGWAPQERILKHPAIGGFLSHCGWNSTLESVCAGVPLLAWPMSAEQHLNRRLLVDMVKVAIAFKGNAFSKEDLEGDVRQKVFVSKQEIEQKVRSLMLGPEGQFIRKNMQILRGKAGDAGAPGGSSQRSLCAYVQLLYDLQVSQK